MVTNIPIVMFVTTFMLRNHHFFEKLLFTRSILVTTYASFYFFCFIVTLSFSSHVSERHLSDLTPRLNKIDDDTGNLDFKGQFQVWIWSKSILETHNRDNFKYGFGPNPYLKFTIGTISSMDWDQIHT